MALRPLFLVDLAETAFDQDLDLAGVLETRAGRSAQFRGKTRPQPSTVPPRPFFPRRYPGPLPVPPIFWRGQARSRAAPAPAIVRSDRSASVTKSSDKGRRPRRGETTTKCLGA